MTTFTKVAYHLIDKNIDTQQYTVTTLWTTN